MFFVKKIFFKKLKSWYYHRYIEYTFFGLKIINPKNIHKNIPEISDQNRISIEVTFFIFFNQSAKNIE